MPSSFDQFFQAATRNAPYDYQRRLAESPCESRLISIPTGLGKTAAVVLAWLWNRAGMGGRGSVRAVESAWPRRLVYPRSSERGPVEADSICGFDPLRR